tara:strand:- start:36 stop:809 length:774 start_codon:yes stop_codon:yes gene_type:complete
MRNEIDNKKLIPVYGLLVISCFLVVNIYNTAFKGGKFTCNRYILNTYLYILLSLIIISLENILLENNNVSLEEIFGRFKGTIGIIILLGISIGLLTLVMTINPKNVIIKHLVWFVYILFLGLLAYPSYLQTIEENTVIVTLFSTISILLMFTSIAFLKPEWISLSFVPILVFLLLGGMIAEICFRFFNKNKNVSMKRKGFAYFFIAVFTLFILYDTKKIQINAKNCKENKVDYINESMGIVLDALNLFQNIADVQSD